MPAVPVRRIGTIEPIKDGPPTPRADILAAATRADPPATTGKLTEINKWIQE